MSFMDVHLPRSRTSAQPRFEVLEARECPAVAAPVVSLSALSSSQVKITWTNVAGENGYRVYQWNGTQPVLLSQQVANTTTFTVGNLAANQKAIFTVEAFDAATTARAPWKAIMTPPIPIAAPNNFKVVGANQTQVSVRWDFSAGAQGYRIYGWDGIRSVQIASVGPSVNSYLISNLQPGSTYYFSVQSFNATSSAITDWVSAMTTANSITAATNVQATTISASTIGLTWNDSIGETGYRVYRWNGVTGNAPVLIATLPANTTGYQAIGLLPGRTYSFYLQAFNKIASARSLWASATTTYAPPLQPPTGVYAQVDGNSSVLLTWTEPARAVGYRVLVWTGLMWTPYATVPAGTHQATVSGLATYSTQMFLVQAFTDNFAEVSYSSAVSVNL